MKIGMIAMSGIRVCDQELLQMGLTLPGFVERSRAIASLPVRLNHYPMLKKERAAFVDRRLEQLYPETPVPLLHSDAYTLLVAVLLSAQCTDERVNQVTPGLFALADNPFDMARKKPATIERIIKACGLAPRKSKAAIW